MAATMTSACSGDTAPGGQAAPGSGSTGRSGPRPGGPAACPHHAAARQVGQPVTGRPEVQLLPRQITGIGLGHRTRLDHRQRRRPAPTSSDGSTSSSSDRADHNISASPREPATALGQHRRRVASGASATDRHTESESATTDNQADIHRVYPTLRDIHRKYFPDPFIVHSKDRHPSEHPRQRRTRKRRASGTATHHPPSPPSSSFATATEDRRTPGVRASRWFRDGRRATSSTNGGCERPPQPTSGCERPSPPAGGGSGLQRVTTHTSSPSTARAAAPCFQ